jgi:hypothetical protein
VVAEVMTVVVGAVVGEVVGEVVVGFQYGPSSEKILASELRILLTVFSVGIASIRMTRLLFGNWVLPFDSFFLVKVWAYFQGNPQYRYS